MSEAPSLTVGIAPIVNSGESDPESAHQLDHKKTLCHLKPDGFAGDDFVWPTAAGQACDGSAAGQASRRSPAARSAWPVVLPVFRPAGAKEIDDLPRVR